MKIYKLLGIDDNIIDWWFTIHKAWNWATQKAKGSERWMRHTG